MLTVNIHEAKTHLSRLLDLAAQAEPFIIAKAGKPVPLETSEAAQVRRLGFMAGQIAVARRFRPFMPRKPNPQPDYPEQFKRFVETAREVEVDESPDAIDRAFNKVIHPAKKSDKPNRPLPPFAVSGGGRDDVPSDRHSAELAVCRGILARTVHRS